LIGKITKGNGFAGLCSYVLGKDEARLIGGNMAARSPNQLAAEFRVFSQRNSQVEKPVEHISLSPSPGDRELDNQEWQAIAQDLLDGLGMSRNQFILVLHSDTEFEAHPRPHIHIIVNRVSIDGQCAPSWLDFHTCEEIIRHLEQKYQLTPVASSWETQRGAESTGEIRRQRRETEQGLEPQESIKRQIQDLCDAAMSDKPSMNQYLQRLKDAGVESRIKETRTGKIQGISYQLEGVAFAGNKLGKNYSWHGLQKLGITEQIQELQPPAPTPKPVSRKSKRRSSGRELEL
jgi:hypothetical protein